MDQVLQNYREQLASNPNDVEAFARLEDALIEAGDWAGLVALTEEHRASTSTEDTSEVWLLLLEKLEPLIEELSDPISASQLALLCARVWEDRLNSPEEAMFRFQAAVQLDQGNLEALRAAKSIYLQAEEWSLVLQLSELECEQLSGSPEDQADLYFYMARICLEEQEDIEGALYYADQAANLLGDDDRLEPYRALSEELHSEERQRLAELLNAAEKARDPRQRASLLIEGALLWSGVAPQDDRIPELLKQALGYDPRNEQARNLLEHFYESNARWEALISYLEDRITHTARKSDRLLIHQRLAYIAQEALQDEERAISSHREVLKLNPVETKSLDACVDFYSSHDRWRELVEVYEAALRIRHRGGDGAAMLVQLAMTLWKKLGDLEGAETYFRRIKLSDPRKPLMLQFYSEFYHVREDWKNLLGVLATRQNKEESIENKISLGLEMADIAEVKLGKLAKAIDIWKSIIRLDKKHEEARESLRRLFFKTTKWNALLEFLKEDLRLTPEEDVDARVAIYEKIIGIYRDQLQLPVMVINTYNQILQINPSNAQALDALQETYETGRRWSELINILKCRVEAAGDDELQQVDLFRQIATIWLGKLSKPKQASPYLEGILELRPHDEEAIAKLIKIYQHRRDWVALFAIYERQVELLEGPELVGRLEEMARIAANRLGRNDQAIQLWQRILEEDAENQDALQALETLYQKAEDWAALAELYHLRAEHLEGQPEQLGWLKKLGDLFSEKLHDEDRAAQVWRLVLQLRPGNLRAENYLGDLYRRRADWVSLEALYAAREDWEGLVRLLGNIVVQEEEVESKVDLYQRMAWICLEHLNDEPNAVTCWERILEEDPQHLESAKRLVPHYRAIEEWDLLVVVLGVILSNQPEEPIEVMVQLARVHEEHRGDAELAFQCFAEALCRAPERADLLEEVQRTAAQAQTWEHLNSILEELLPELSPESEERFRRVLAQSCAQELGSWEEAATHYERVLELSGDSTEILSALEGLYKRLSRWQELLEIYGKELELSQDPKRRVEIQLSIGQLHEKILKRPKAAESSYKRLLKLDPSSVEALQGLQRLAEARDDIEALQTLVAAELEIVPGSVQRAELLQRLGTLAMLQGQDEEAIKLFARVLQEIPTHEEATAALEEELEGPLALQAAKILEPIMRGMEEWESLRRVLRLQVEISEEPNLRPQLLEEISEIEAQCLGEIAAAFETSRELLIEDRLRPSARERLERFAEELGTWGVVAELYRRFALEGALAEEESQLLYSRLLAQLLEEHLGNFSEARETLLALLEAQGDDLEILEAVDRLSTRLEDWQGLVNICARKLELLSAPSARLEMLFRMADLWEEMLDDPLEAIQIYQQIHTEAPSNERALEALERILRNVGFWDDLAQLFQGRLEEAEGELALSLGFQLAQLLEKEMNDPEHALARYAKVLEQDPGHLPSEEALENFLEEHQAPEEHELRALACEILEPIYSQRREWIGGIHLLQIRLEDAQEPSERQRLNILIAELYEREADDPAEAMQSYGKALNEDYSSREVLEQLLRLAESLEAWEELAKILRRGLDGAQALNLEPELRREILGRVARLYEDRVGDRKEAIIFNQRILEEDEADLEAMASLDRLYTQQDRISDLVEILECRAQLLENPEEQVALNFRLGELYELRLEDHDQAVAAYRRICQEIDPEELSAYVALERLHATAAEFSQLVEVLLEHAQRLEPEEKQKRLLFRAAATYEDGLDQAEEAIAVYRQILEMDASDRNALGHLDRLYEQLERPEDLLEILERECQLAEQLNERNTYEYRMAMLLISSTEDLPQAVERLSVILELDPKHKPSREALEALLQEPEVRLRAAHLLIPLYESDQAWLSLRDTLRGTLEDLEEPQIRVETLCRIATIEREPLDEALAAFSSLSEAYQESLADEEIEAELERLAEFLEAEADLADLFAEVIPSVPERAISLHLKIANLAEQRLEDLQRAIQEHTEVLEIEPESSEALDALERLYERSEEHEALVEILERKLELTERIEVLRPLFIRVATIQEEWLKRPEASIETWRRLLAEDEREEEALDNLERLLDELERWPELSALLEHRLGISEGEERLEVQYRLARILEEQLQEGERALALYREILEKENDHEGARSSLAILFAAPERAELMGVDPLEVALLLEPLYRERKDYKALVPVLELCQEAQDERTRRIELLQEIAKLQEQELLDLNAAFRSCGQLLSLAPELESCRQDLRRLAEETQSHDRLAELLKRIAEESLEEQLKVALLLELAYVEESHRGDKEAARNVLHEVLSVDPENTQAVDSLVKLFSRTASWDELVDLYLGLAENQLELKRQKELYFKAAHLLEDVVEDSERAIEVYRKILEIDPSNSDSFKALEHFFSEGERWSEFVLLLQDEQSYVQEGAERAALRYRLGEVLEQHIKDLDGAISAWQSILEEDEPGHEKALKALERLLNELEQDDLCRQGVAMILTPLYEEAESWSRWSEVVEVRLEFEEDSLERRELLGRVAQVQEKHLGNQAAAYEAYSRAFLEEYGDPELQRELDRLAEELGAWRSLVDCYLSGIDEFHDLDAALLILLKVATIFDRQLQDPERAIESYRRALQIDDLNIQALDALERILESEGKYEELVSVLARKAEQIIEVIEKKELLYRICAIYESILDKPQEAINSYRQIFEEDPEDKSAIEALIPLYERTQQWGSLVEVLREKLEVAEEGERKGLLFQIAEVFELRVGNFDETILSYRSILEIDSKEQRALEALERLFSQEGRWGELIDLLEGEREQHLEESPERVDILDLRIADILEHQLAQLARGTEIYGEVLNRSPENPKPREALETILRDHPAQRSLAAQLLAAHYEARGEPEEQARVLEFQLQDLEEQDDRLEQLKRLAKLRHEILDQPQGAYEAYARAFREDCADLQIIEPLHALADELGLFADLAQLYLEQSKSVLDQQLLRSLHKRRAQIYDEKLADPQQAIIAWQQVLNDDDDDAEALEALDRLYQFSQNWPALISILRRRIDLGGEEDSVDLCFRLGYLLEVLEEDLATAIELYRNILWERPDHGYSREAMERLAIHLEYRQLIAEGLGPIYREEGEWEKLSILTEMRIELSMDPLERARLWSEIAEIQEQHLENIERAFEAYLQAFSELPSDEEIREQLLRLTEQRGEWPRLVAAYESAQAHLEDLDLQIEDRLCIADWCEQKLSDSERATTHYRLALEMDPNQERALEALERLYQEAEEWAPLADVLRRKAENLFDLEEKRLRLHQLGQLCAERLNDRTAAVSAYEESLQIDDNDNEALTALEALHEEAKDWSALLDILERRSDGLYDGQRLVALHRRMGQIAQEKLLDLPRAADSWEQVLVHEPEAQDALNALRKIYRESERWDRLQELLVKELSLGEESRRLELLSALGENAELHLKNSDSAMEYYRQILVQRPEETQALERLSALYAEAGHWFELVEVLGEHLKARRAQGEKGDRDIDLLVRIAQIAEEELQDSDLAVQSLNEVLEQQPQHEGALIVLARLYEREKRWKEAAEVLERSLAGGGRAETLRRLGLLYLERLERSGDGLRILEQAAEKGDEEAIQKLLIQAREAGDQAREAKLLEQLLNSDDQEERGPLLLKLAELKKALGETEAQIKALEEARLLYPKDMKLSDVLLEAYFEAGRHAEAEPLLNDIIQKLKSMRRSKELFRYNYRLGCIAEERGDEEAALAAFTACFEDDATYLPNLRHLGRLHFKREDWDKALRIFQTILLHQRKLDKEGRVETFYHLGQIRLAKQDQRRARDMFKRALGLDPQHEGSRTALEALNASN